MKIEDFIAALEEEFDDIEQGTLKAGSDFRESLEWNSINALLFIALCDAEYDVMMSADDIDKAVTIQDLFDTIETKMKG
ncbi:MAG: acyl carrier protein [Bacteroidales bacterium]|nr:acyl carrier protein [Bacteroidales bacterium]MCF8458726.1 acyl carrier protein [Bacteroidales bacterium]